MSNQKIILESLALDLKRVALGLHRGSLLMAKQFAGEALRRKHEIDIHSIHPYMKKLLHSLERTMNSLNEERTAEDALMFSVLVENYIQKQLE